MSKKSKKTKTNKDEAKNDNQLIASNRKASYDYQFLETVEAGLCLAGCEIKSVREGRVSIGESFAYPKDGELFLHGMHIQPYPSARDVPSPTRSRKLLLHKRQITKLTAMVSQEGLTIIPTKMYLSRGLAKVELALAKGKSHKDRRDDIKRRDADRQVQRAMKR